MIGIVRIRREPEESQEEESPEYEWAEYNLPLAVLMGLAADDEDSLAFLGLGMESDDGLPEGSA